MADAHAFGAARGARPLRGRNRDRVIDSPQMVRGGRSRVRLTRRLAGLWLLGRWRVDPRCFAQPAVGILERVGSARLVVGPLIRAA
jgi:hypothetical protein